MSYCRWSSCNFACDVYCYESVGGFFAVHVAGGRRVSDKPRPNADVSLYGENLEGFVAAHDALMEWVRTADLVPIGLPCDGESYELPDAAAAADKLEELRALGYLVPRSAIEALREEAA